jgi:hypothetical protein
VSESFLSKYKRRGGRELETSIFFHGEGSCNYGIDNRCLLIVGICCPSQLMAPEEHWMLWSSASFLFHKDSADHMRLSQRL